MGRIRQAGILVATNKLRSLAPYVEIVMWPNSRVFCVNLLPVKFDSCKVLVESQLRSCYIFLLVGSKSKDGEKERRAKVGNNIGHLPPGEKNA